VKELASRYNPVIKIGSHIALHQSRLYRFIYNASLPWIVKRKIDQKTITPLTVYSLSYEKGLPEQVASIRSFIKNVGVPNKFVVVSDGSYSERSKQLIRAIHPCVSVCDWFDFVRSDLPEYVRSFSALHPMGIKFSVLLSIPVDEVANETAIYTDCDILFFPAATELSEIAASKEHCSYYLPDCEKSLDSRLLFTAEEGEQPINAGFIIFKQEIDWSIALHRLSELEGGITYYLEQTLVHLALHHNKASPLATNKFIMDTSDLFIYRDLFASDQIAIRHYVNTVRHKFWLSNFGALKNP
jgi:hypothetical protein